MKKKLYVAGVLKRTAPVLTGPGIEKLMVLCWAKGMAGAWACFWRLEDAVEYLGPGNEELIMEFNVEVPEGN